MLSRRLESACRKAIYDFDLIREDRIAIALSGGKDSLTLLHLLNAIRGRGVRDFELVAIHVSGEYSCGPSISLRAIEPICKEMGVPLIVKESKQKLETLACYSCSRERRRLIFNAAKEAGAYTIAFGHHRDDSIETLLLNLLHKAEFAANLPFVPMEDYGINIIRPLIYIEERDIITFAKQKGFARISCQCPVGQKSKRGEVKRLLPEIEEIFPNTRQNLALAAMMYGSKKAYTK